MSDHLSIARECGATVTESGTTGDRPVSVVTFNEFDLAAYTSRIRAEERERAAKVCDDRAADHEEYAADPDNSDPKASLLYAKHVRRCAAAIRAASLEDGA